MSDGEKTPAEGTIRVPDGARAGKDTDASSGSSSWGFWTTVRRVVAALLIVLATALVLASHYSHSLETCDDQVARIGPTQSVRICGAVPVVDVLPVVFLAILLLVPDFDEVSIAGVGSLRRRLEQQRERQDLLSERLQMLEQTAFAAASARADPRIYIGSDVAGLALRGAQVELGGVVEPPGEAPAEQTKPSESRASLTEKLLHVWSTELSEFAQLADRALQSPAFGDRLRAFVADRTDGVAPEQVTRISSERRMLAALPSDFSPPDVDRLLDWYRAYRTEIELVRQIRNEAAHAGPVDEATLQGAVTVAQELVEALQASLSGAELLNPQARAERLEELAIKALQGQGWTVDRQRDGFDLVAHRGNEDMYVELNGRRRLRRQDADEIVGRVLRHRATTGNAPQARYAFVVTVQPADVAGWIPAAVRRDLRLELYLADLERGGMKVVE